MTLCKHCARAEFHGYPPQGSPEWEVGTVYFWCPTLKTHRQHSECDGHVEGEPRLFDKHGKEMANDRP